MYNIRFATKFYEQFYGICNHERSTNPLDSVTLNPKEEFFRDTQYDNRLRKYMELDILGKTGISFSELLDMSRFEITNLFRVVSSFGQFKSKLEETEQKKMERKRKLEEDAERRKQQQGQIKERVS